MVPYLVNMMVLVFSSNDRCYRVSFWCYSLGAAVVELCTLLLQASLHSCSISVVVFAVLNTGHTMLVLLWQNFAILHWLDGGVVMVLVDLAVNCGLSFLMALLDNVFLDDGGSDLFMHCGVMVTSLVPMLLKD